MTAFTTLTLLAIVGLPTGPTGPTGPTTADDVKSYHLVPALNADSAIRIAVPYTFGTHEFVGRAARGEVKLRTKTAQVISGRMTLPIGSLETSNKTMECHTREALGLDYRKSKFPGEHVCQNGRLPSSGNDAVAFPEITFDYKSSKLLDPDPGLALGKKVRIEVFGRWTIHGVGRDDKVILTVVPAVAPHAQSPVIRVTGRATIRLSDYGILVKPALFIKAGEVATIELNLLLAENP